MISQLEIWHHKESNPESSVLELVPLYSIRNASKKGIMTNET